jgi:hypothetical protein
MRKRKVGAEAFFVDLDDRADDFRPSTSANGAKA